VRHQEGDPDCGADGFPSLLGGLRVSRGDYIGMGGDVADLRQR
jgi:hypothetical protein